MIRRVLPALLLIAAAAQANDVEEIYRGRLVRSEEISRQSNPFLRGRFLGMIDNRLAFQITQYDRVEIFSRPIYEKVIVRRQANNPNDAGFRTVIPNEFVEGEPVRREEVAELEPIANVPFRYKGNATEEAEYQVRSNQNGVLLDVNEAIMSQFEDLRNASTVILFQTESLGSCQVELTRADFNEKLGIHYEYRKASQPQNLKAFAEWDKAIYQPGDTAVLTLHLKNQGSEGEVVRLLSRSMSRWDWLDGKMFYLGDIAPGDQKSFSRQFKVPANAATGTYYLRAGFNDISGAKPQLPLTLRVAYTNAASTQ